MTMVAQKEHDATLMAEAVVMRHWRLRQQWWWQKQWDNNDSNNRQQSRRRQQ
jgi:hypothetical protein